jgi:hypothetical protein
MMEARARMMGWDFMLGALIAVGDMVGSVEWEVVGNRDCQRMCGRKNGRCVEAQDSFIACSRAESVGCRDGRRERLRKFALASITYFRDER